MLLDTARVGATAYRARGEVRWAAIGAMEFGRVLFVVFTERGEKVRVVTGRDEEEKEKRRYRRGWGMADGKRMKEISTEEEIPEFETEEEGAEFRATHSLGEEHLEKMDPIPESVLPPATRGPRSRPLSVRFDEEAIRRLKAVSEKKYKGYQTLLKEFVTERLYEEEKREGLLEKS